MEKTVEQWNRVAFYDKLKNVFAVGSSILWPGSILSIEKCQAIKTRRCYANAGYSLYTKQ